MKSRQLMLSLFALGALYGCNTVEGIGEDLETGGEKIQEEAEEHQ
jgi:predicted small secreted protein